MQALSNAVLAFFDLVETETDLLRKKALDLVGLTMLVIGAALAAFIGIGLLLVALYDSLQLQWPAPWPAVCTAMICFTLTGILLWFVSRKKN
jgi:hypothetical protein